MKNLTKKRQAVLDGVVERIKLLRKDGDEQAAYDAMKAAIESGEISEEEAARGYYEQSIDDYMQPDWFTSWSVAYEREKAKASGLPYEHLNAL